MKKTAKYLRFQNLKMQLDQKHPKQVSRAIIVFKDEDQNISKTNKYGQVTPQTIQWNDVVEVLYTNQEVFKIETKCEHEYGYQLDELEALYNGQIYIKTQNFFRPLLIHVFNNQGTKCGILKYLIKVVQKQIVKTAKKQQVVQQQAAVEVSLIGKLTIYAAAIKISNIIFKKDKYVNQFSLFLTICGQKLQASYRKNFEWSFPATKVQYNQNSPDQIIVELQQNDEVVLRGSTTMNSIIENKRFVTHSIPVYNHNQQKIGTLKLDLRYITKQQLLDLMYSPTKLTKKQQQKDKKGQLKNDSTFKNKNTNLEAGSLSRARVNSSLMITSRKKQQLINAVSQYELPHDRSANRYKKVHVTNGYNQIIFSKAKRFSEPKNVNPYVSYCDPTKLSDFSPQNKNGYNHVKGPDISTSKKYDFTRPTKGHPGVGQYKLPSIWDKY